MKRLSTADPLTVDDVAERIDRAAFRLLSILMEARQQDDDRVQDILASRYDRGCVEALGQEIQDHWQYGGGAPTSRRP